MTVHEGRLVEADQSRREGIPVTAPARTLADLAHVLGDRDLERAVREARIRRLFHLPSMLAVLDRRPAKALRHIIEDLGATQSHLEDRLLGLCRRHRLPAPQTQRVVRGSRMDFVWPAQRLVVEADSYQAHAIPAAFQQDRTTTNRLQLAGYTVLRFTHADITRRPGDVARQIRQALGQ